MAKRKKREEPIEPEVLDAGDDFTEKDLAQIEDWAAIGLNLGDIAARLEMGRTTLWRKVGKNPRILETIKSGRAIGKEIRLRALNQQIMLGDVTAIKYGLQAIDNMQDGETIGEIELRNYEDLWQRLQNLNRANRKTMETLQLSGQIAIKKS